MWILVRKIKNFPEGGPESASYLAAEITELRETLRVARTFGKMERSEKAKQYWADLYENINKDAEGAKEIVDRAEAHMLRLSNMYATASRNPQVDLEHLLAAEALWKYSEACALQIFGVEELSREADLLLGYLRSLSGDKMSRTLIQNRVFHNHKTGTEITALLRILHDKGLVQYTTERIENGNTIEQWFATKYSNNGTPAKQSSDSTASGNYKNNMRGSKQT
jgi:hypothetical protein